MITFTRLIKLISLWPKVIVDSQSATDAQCYDNNLLRSIIPIIPRLLKEDAEGLNIKTAMSAKSLGTLAMIYAIVELQNPLPRKTMLWKGDMNISASTSDKFLQK